MRSETTDSTTGYMAFLMVLLPAVQIYYLSTIDAVVAALLTGALYFFAFTRGAKAVAMSTALLCASFLLTFVSMFILPVLAGYELIVKRSLKRSVLVFGLLILFYALLYLLTGYDAWHSFREASHYENPNGFMLFVDPANYFFTRLEDIAELVLFLGPFLLLLLIRGTRLYSSASKLRERPLVVLTWLAIGTILAMFAVGAWRTGETARACVFLYPYLLFPIAYYLDGREMNFRSRISLAALVFLQSLGMQLIGNFHW
jgi:hypothetical protein